MIATLTAAVTCGVSYPVAAEISNVAAGIVVGKVGSQSVNIRELEVSWKSKGSGFVGANSHKISTVDTSQLLINAWKVMNEKIVMTFGCFDFIHPGYIHYLNHSKALGDRLIVCLYSNEFIRKYEGENRPVLNQNDRADILSAFQYVDLVILLDKEQLDSVVKTLAPDIFIRSGDGASDNLISNDYILSLGCKIETVPRLNGYSSSSLIKNILKI